MDALARIEPVARPLIARVDTALSSLGAPPGHAVWPLLREIGATPGDVVGFVAALSPEQVRPVAARLRRIADGYGEAVPVAGVAWQGAAGAEYAGEVAALSAHLADVLPEGVHATADCLELMADWQERSRRAMARALADVLVSSEAVTLRQEEARVDRPPASRAGVLAAADISVHVLESARAIVREGADVRAAWSTAVAVRSYRSVPLAGSRGGAVIEVRPTHGGPDRRGLG